MVPVSNQIRRPKMSKRSREECGSGYGIPEIVQITTRNLRANVDTDQDALTLEGNPRDRVQWTTMEREQKLQTMDGEGRGGRVGVTHQEASVRFLGPSRLQTEKGRRKLEDHSLDSNSIPLSTGQGGGVPSAFFLLRSYVCLFCLSSACGRLSSNVLSVGACL